MLGALIVLVAFLDLFSQLPIVAPFARSVGASDSQIGIVVAIYSATNLVGNVLAGQMLDLWGRRPALLIGLGGTGLALLLYSLTQSTAQLLGVRAVHGLVAGFLTPTAFTLLADASLNRSRAMGIGGSLVGAAAIIGPAASGLIRARLGFDAIFYIVSSLMFLTLLAGASVLSRGAVARRRPDVQAPVSWRAGSLLRPCVAVFALLTTLGVLTAYLPVHLESQGHAKAVPGVMLSLFAIGAVIAMVSPLGRLSEHFGTRRPMLWGLIAAGGGLLALAVAPSLLLTGTAMVVYGVGFGLIFPSANVAAAEAGGEDRRGRAFAILYATFSVGVVTGGLLSAAASGFNGIESLPYYLGVGVALGGAGVLARLR